MRLRNRWIVVIGSALLLCGAAPNVRPANAADPDDGIWRPVGAPLPRFAHAMCVDPTRGRLFVFGGSHPNGYSNDLLLYSFGSESVWLHLNPPGPQPSPRNGHAMVTAMAADRLAVFGGLTTSGLLQDLWLLDLADPNQSGAWQQVAPAGTQPPVRYQHAMAYDPIRNRLVVFGGGGNVGVTLQDVWAYSFATNNWAQITPAVAGPTARRGSTMIYDPVRDRMVVFGGQGPGLTNDVWALSLGDTPAWSPLLALGPPPTARAYHSAVYDPASDAMLVLGGNASSGIEDDVWRLSLSPTAAWSQDAPSGSSPDARLLSAAAYDPAHARVVVFGGAGAQPAYADLWELDVSAAPSWERMQPPGDSPAPRRDMSVIVQPLKQRAILFGGTHALEGPLYNDTWVIPLMNESASVPLVTFGIVPRPRRGHAAIFDPVRERMLVLGGFVAGGSEGEVLELTLGDTPTWSVLTTAGPVPAPRNWHTATYDPVGDRVIMIGGLSAIAPSNEAWQLSLAGTPTWTKLAHSTPGFSGHVAVLDPLHNRIVVHGATHVYSLTLSDPPVWTQHSPADMPPSRQYHAGVLDALRNRLVIFGGDLQNGPDASDCWALSLAQPQLAFWSQLSPDRGPPSTRQKHAAVYDGMNDRMLVFGGYSSQTLLPRPDAMWALQWFSIVGVDPGAGSPRLPGVLTALPNPARSNVALTFHLAEAQDARLRVTDVQGRLVAERTLGRLPAGEQRVEWDGKGLGGRASPGLYFCAIEAGATSFRQRVVLLPR